MLVNTRELFKDAEKNNYAIAAINTPSLTVLRAVIEAAEYEGMPVILSLAEGQTLEAPIDIYGPLMAEMASRSKVPFAVHLDHGFHEEFILKAIRNGFTSVMADFSRYPYEENVVRTKAMVDICHELDITVEGEFGEMPSNLKGHTIMLSEVKDLNDIYTDPAKVKSYIDDTGIDSLVVSFGSVHGVYLVDPVMDFDRLKAIKKNVGDFPLVMHGGSGLSAKDTRMSIDNGIRKINYYTYMSCEPAKHLPAYLANPENSTYYEKIAEFCRQIMLEKAKYAINLFKNKK